MIIARCTTLVLALALTGHAVACDPLDVDGRALTIRANRDHTAHIVSPEPIVGDRVGNKAAFETSFLPNAPTHYWIKPRKSAPDDASTSLTLLTATGAIDFIVQRDDQVRGPCYQLAYPESIGGVVDASTPAATAGAEAFVAGASTATVYRVKGRGVANTRDDGRFTYITLDHDPIELPMVTSGDVDAPEPVNIDVDGRVLRVAGIYTELHVHLGGRKPVRIVREA